MRNQYTARIEFTQAEIYCLLLMVDETIRITALLGADYDHWPELLRKLHRGCRQIQRQRKEEEADGGVERVQNEDQT